MYQIARTYEFAAAHRLKGHPKCGRLHGHNYTVEVVLRAVGLRGGMLMDFQDLDKIVKPIIEELDHHFINTEENRPTGGPDSTMDDDVYLNIERSTAECLAAWIFYQVRQYTELVKEVTVWETSRSKATFYLTDGVLPDGPGI